MSVDFLNATVEYTTRANAMLNPIIPKSGIFLMGEKGIEFRSEKGPGFIQIPWTSVENIFVQMLFGGRYVRGFTIATDEGLLFEFVVNDAKDTLKYMRKYLERDVFQASKSNISKVLGQFKK